MIKAVFFDLDGTLLPLDEDLFIKTYFKLLSTKLEPFGYNKEDLYRVILNGIEAMYKNDDGKMTNEEVFYKCFNDFYGKEKVERDRKVIDEFYLNEFKLLKSTCKDNPLAKEIIEFCKSKNLFVGLSTNPFFPKVATLTRMGFVDLKEEDFNFVTTYEDNYYCKPNPKYFLALLEKYNLKSEEVILFGNNDYEDGECSLAIGMKCYLVDGCIINKPNTKHKFEVVKMEEVIPMIEKYIG